MMPTMMRQDQPKRAGEGTQEAGRNALIEQVAQRVEAAGMSAPAIAFLEANRPLAFVSSQMLLVAQPFLAPLLASLDGWIDILEDRGSVQRLISRLEQGPGKCSPPA